MIFDDLEHNRKRKRTQVLALVDPDSKNDSKLPQIMDIINISDFDAILVGGSSISDDRFEDRILYINNNTDLPVIIFPGDSSQVSKNVNSILFLSLLSGRNPKYLVEEQVLSSRYIYKHNLETIPTGYLLLKTDKKSAVEKVSNTEPLDMRDKDNIISHALAAQYMGKKSLFSECGSDSNLTIDPELLNEITKHVDIPVMVGGGIKNKEMAISLAQSGASYLVIGSLIEQTLDSDLTIQINSAISTLNEN